MNFFSKYKTIFLIIGFIGTVIMIGYFIFRIFFKPMLPTETPEDIIVTKQQPLPTAGEGEIIKQEPTIEKPLEGTEFKVKPTPIAVGGITKTSLITEHDTLAPSLSGNGRDLQYYNQDDGKFYTVTKNGEILALSDKQFFNVESVEWSPTKQKAVIEYPDGANIIYNFKTEEQITLPSHWEEFKFSPAGDQITMKSIGLDPNNRWLAIVNEDGSGAKSIEPIGLNGENIYPSWSPNNQIIGMELEGIDMDRQEVYFMGLNGENFRSTVIHGRGFEHKWAPQGDKLLYSVYSDLSSDKPSLWSVDARGESIGANRKKLNVETWASKCAFHNQHDLYCAVPEELPEGAGLFPRLAEDIPDKFYKIDVKTGQKKLIAVPDSDFTADSVMVSDDGSFLYFTDNKTKGIQQIRLK